MANQNGSSDELQQMTGNQGVDTGGDPYDSTTIMNRKVARLAGSPVALVDREFQRLNNQTPRTLAQNTPTQAYPRSRSISGIMMSAARSRGRARKKF